MELQEATHAKSQARARRTTPGQGAACDAEQTSPLLAAATLPAMANMVIAAPFSHLHLHDHLHPPRQSPANAHVSGTSYAGLLREVLPGITTRDEEEEVVIAKCLKWAAVTKIIIELKALNTSVNDISPGRGISRNKSSVKITVRWSLGSYVS